MSIRTGDAIFDRDARGVWIVEDHDRQNVHAREANTGRVKDFDARDLECIDADDGVWQEMDHG